MKKGLYSSFVKSKKKGGQRGTTCDDVWGPKHPGENLGYVVCFLLGCLFGGWGGVLGWVGVVGEVWGVGGVGWVFFLVVCGGIEWGGGAGCWVMGVFGVALCCMDRCGVVWAGIWVFLWGCIGGFGCWGLVSFCLWAGVKLFLLDSL